jgi:steroid delta-isomerase-like uncharacterized protein
MSTEENKAAERRYYEEVWRKRNLAAIDELVAPEFVDHDPLPGQGPGREGFRQAGPALAFSAFPDAQITIEDVIAEGDTVVTRWTCRGTHRGALMGIPPTHKQVTVAGIEINRYAGGQRVEAWRQWDALGLLRQLGAIPPPGQGTP